MCYYIFPFIMNAFISKVKITNETFVVFRRRFGRKSLSKSSALERGISHFREEDLDNSSTLSNVYPSCVHSIFVGSVNRVHLFFAFCN